MLKTTRTAFHELPDGTYRCTVDVITDTPQGMSAIPFPPNPIGTVEDMAPRLDDEFAVKLNQESTAIAAPTTASSELAAPAQTIGAGGMSTESVMAPSTLANWKHPAAKKMHHIYLHPPFQQFARDQMKITDPFVADIPNSIAFLRARVASAATVEDAQERLSVLVSEYETWCGANAWQPWPEGDK